MIVNTLKRLGPGLLFAGAAIGVSHLVQSTRAGASFGFELVWLVVLINILKYPFFEIGHRYTSAMDESLIYGYKRLGNWAVYLYFILNLFASVMTISAVTFVASAIFNFLIFIYFGIEAATDTTAIFYFLVVMAILYFGKYSLLENFVKYLIVSLSFFTFLAVILATNSGVNISSDFIPSTVWEQANIGFLLALMGWMPAPIELSTWTSLWSLEKENETKQKTNIKDSLFDFNIGYFICIIIAVFFVLLGAFIMYGSGEEFSNNGSIFASQLIDLYSKSIGAWSKPLIAFIAFVTMFSTVVTCTDAYPRTLEESLKTIKGVDKNERKHKYYWFFLILIVIFSSIIIFFFTSKLKVLVDMVTTVAFLSSPIFALLNYLLIRKDFIPLEYRTKTWLNMLSILGLLFFFGFGLYYIYVLSVF